MTCKNLFPIGGFVGCARRFIPSLPWTLVALHVGQRRGAHVGTICQWQEGSLTWRLGQFVVNLWWWCVRVNRKSLLNPTFHTWSILPSTRKPSVLPLNFPKPSILLLGGFLQRLDTVTACCYSNGVCYSSGGFEFSFIYFRWIFEKS